MSDKKLPYWLAVEDDKLVKFADLAHMMARAYHPSDAESYAYAAARINLEEDLPKAVQNGELVVRNRAGLGRHTFPMGDALQRAVMMPSDLRPFLETRFIELRLIPHGSGPNYWTLENAAIAIAEQEQWHDGARGSLLDALMEAAASRALVVRDPHTDLPKPTGEVREFYELVTPADVNAWLEAQGAPYRWNVAAPIATPEPPDAPVAAVPASVEAVRGIDKRKVMAGFNGLKWDYDHWGKNLASPSNTLKACRVAQGSKTASALWNPAEIGLYLLDEGVPIKKLDAVFVVLSDWADEWREKTALERD